MRQKLKYENELNLQFIRTGTKDPAGSKVHDETDDEAEDRRKALAAAMEERRKHFCSQARSCFEALPEALQPIFGPMSTTRRVASGHIDLRDCFEQLSMVDALEDDFQPVYSCSTCRSTLGHRTFASRCMWLWPADLPPIVTIHLKRFRRFAADYVKSVTSVLLPEELNLNEFVMSEGKLESLAAYAASEADFAALKEKMQTRPAGPLTYELYAICEHQGPAMQDGHYVAYVNSGPSLAREEWFGLSDTKVWKCERAEVLKVEA